MRRFLAAVALSTIMAPQLRAQDIVPPAKKPDSVTVRGTDYWAAVPAQPTRPIPKESILRVDTLRAATRRADGICNYDQKAARAITPTPGSGTRLLPTHVDPVACRIIVVTVDTAKFVEATKQAKRDTLVKPAVIYTYPPDRFAKDSTARAKAPVVKTVPPPVKPDSSTVTLFRHAPHGTTVFQMPAKVDTAEIRWMKDTVRVELTDRRRDMVIGEPRVRGDTAWVRASRMETKLGVPTYEFAIDHLFVRRGGRWTFTNQLTMMHSHFAPPPKTHAPVKPRPDTVRTFRSDNPATATPESFRDVVRQDLWPLTAKDTAEIQRIALTYLKADSNYVRTVDRRPLQIRGDTALATFFYGAEVTFVRLARRQGTWVPTYRGSGIK